MSVYGAVKSEPVKESQECSPLSCYGVGKHSAEGYLRIYQDKLPFVAMRMFNVYGPGQNMSNLRQGMVSIYLAQALDSGTIEVKGNVDRFRDLIFIDDVVEAWFRAATYQSAIGQTINLGTGVKTTVANLLHQICELVPGSDYFVTNGTVGDQSGIFADTTNLQSKLSMTAFTPVNEGLKKFIYWALKSEKSGPILK
jgi:UDP-glucose 4-epimerase